MNSGGNPTARNISHVLSRNAATSSSQDVRFALISNVFLIALLADLGCKLLADSKGFKVFLSYFLRSPPLTLISRSKDTLNVGLGSLVFFGSSVFCQFPNFRLVPYPD